MLIEVVGVGQELQLSTGESLNLLTLRLPDNAVYKVAVDDLLVAHIIKLFVADGGEAAARAAASSRESVQARRTYVNNPGQQVATFTPPGAVAGDHATHMVEDESGNAVFGGDYDDPARDPSAAPAEGDWEVAASPAPLGTPQVRAPLTVQADAGGNPVVQGRNVVDQTTLVGGRSSELEDDGIGSI